VFQSAVVESSGNREVDYLALNAVRRASPLPVPPNGGPIYPHFTFSLR
jgi:TonB family protein